MSLKDYTCDRCLNKHPENLRMSWFNEDMLCPECREKEEQHKDFEKAKQAVLNEERKGNMNFKGIGLKK